MAAQETQITIGERTFTVRYSWKAFCALTTALNASFATVTEALFTADASDVDAVVWAGLITRHPEVSRQDVRDMLDEVGVVASMEAVDFCSARFVDSLQKEGGGSTANPLKAALSRWTRRLGLWIGSWWKPKRPIFR
jgi:hypothetical protein